jgi:2,6-dihydroxypyridine 3-monooxygenase
MPAIPGKLRVVVLGGSIGGLTAALVLRDAGCDVKVYERSSAALQARGAGIAALDATLRYLTERGGRRRDDVCSATNWIRFLRPDGGTLHEQRHRYLFSSWNTIYRSLLGEFDPDRYLLGREVTALGPAGDQVRVTLADGTGADADLLVCADGVSSLARARLLPEVSPSYSGYVAWRGTLPERALPAATRALFGDAITYQVIKDSHVLVYPIPGPGGALTAGDRLVNFVWYVNVAEGGELDQLMTGRDGLRRAVSLPPGAASEDAVTAMRQAAMTEFARPIAEVVTGVAEPFVQVVYDIAVPRMVFGRTCLIGDAAFAVRPHAAAGTAKAAADGWALADALIAAGGDVPAALARWERQQLALGRALLARCRDIGDSSQFGGTFRPGDQRLIFGLYGPGN